MKEPEPQHQKEPAPVVVRTLEGYRWSKILAASQSEGYRMVSRMLTDFDAGTNRFDAPGEILLAHLADDGVVAMCGLNREADTKFGCAGRVRRLYVMPSHRGKGLARSLIEAIGAFAARHYDALAVNAGSPGARAFFEHMEFRPISHPNITHCKRLEAPGRGF